MTAPFDSGDGLLSALGLKLVNMIGGAIASFAALRFFDGLSTFDKWSTFIGGWALAVWGAEPLTTFLGLSPRIEIGLVLLLGLFGMSTAAEIIKLIKATEWGLLLRQFFEAMLRLIGRKP